MVYEWEGSGPLQNYDPPPLFFQLLPGLRQSEKLRMNWFKKVIHLFKVNNQNLPEKLQLHFFFVTPCGVFIETIRTSTIERFLEIFNG